MNKQDFEVVAVSYFCRFFLEKPLNVTKLIPDTSEK